MTHFQHFYGRHMEYGRPLYFPRLISAVRDWMSAILPTWCGLSAQIIAE